MLTNHFIKIPISVIAVAATLFIVSIKTHCNASDSNTIDNNSGFEVMNHYEKTIVHLYYADKDNSNLTSETRSLINPEDPAKFGKAIITALLRGPKNELTRTIPQRTSLRAFFIASDGTAYVDLSENISENHPGGIKSEIITIYSIVNTLILNVEAIKKVKLLINGLETDTLAGHIDARFPFKADMLLIR